MESSQKWRFGRLQHFSFQVLRNTADFASCCWSLGLWILWQLERCVMACLIELPIDGSRRMQCEIIRTYSDFPRNCIGIVEAGDHQTNRSKLNKKFSTSHCMTRNNFHCGAKLALLNAAPIQKIWAMFSDRLNKWRLCNGVFHFVVDRWMQAYVVRNHWYSFGFSTQLHRNCGSLRCFNKSFNLFESQLNCQSQRFATERGLVEWRAKNMNQCECEIDKWTAQATSRQSFVRIKNIGVSNRKYHCFDSIEKCETIWKKGTAFDWLCKALIGRKTADTNMSISEMIGWDLLYQLIEKDLKTESDIIVAITHWYLIKEAGFRCLGTGDEVSTPLEWRKITAVRQSQSLSPTTMRISTVNLKWICVICRIEVRN